MVCKNARCRKCLAAAAAALLHLRGYKKTQILRNVVYVVNRQNDVGRMVRVQ